MIFCTSGCFLFFHDGHKELLGHLAALAGESEIIVAVNSDEYLYKKHSDQINTVLKNRNIKQVDKIKLQLSLDSSIRCKDVQDFLEDRGVAVVSDNLLEYLESKSDVVWVVGDDYYNKHFKEKDDVYAVYITPRTTGETSSSRFAKIKEP